MHGYDVFIEWQVAGVAQARHRGMVWGAVVVRERWLEDRSYCIKDAVRL